MELSKGMQWMKSDDQRTKTLSFPELRCFEILPERPERYQKKSKKKLRKLQNKYKNSIKLKTNVIS